MARTKKIPTVIVDYDDTVVNFLGSLCQLHNAIHGGSLHVNDIDSWNFLNIETTDVRGNKVTGKDLSETFKAFENHGLYAQLPILPFAETALRLIRKLGYKIIIMTARKEEFEKQTVLNLIHHNLPYDDLIFTSEKATAIKHLQKTHKVYLFADDKLSTVEDVYSKCRVKHVFLIEMAHNRNIEIDEGVKIIGNLFESVRYLKDLS